ncbi:MAG: DPP IV N-terminal domain-containing protein [Bacteroidales bacterium]|jgi:dipeptidyl-peptidase-4|nr:DPP IV N-terminal domain-containing protein [Bacteroidales bacterium]
MKTIFKLSIFLFLCGISISSISQKINNEISLIDIFTDKTFTARTISGLRSMNDGEHFTTLESRKKIIKYSYKTGEVIDILFSTLEKDFDINNYEFSSDESKVLLSVNAEFIYRRSYTADYYIYDITTKKLEKLSNNGRQKFVNFSPNALKVAFVRDNNIFIKNLKTKDEKQITFDGKFNYIINGGTDWVYEEEYSFTRAFFWSPKGDKIAYYKFNEKDVPDFNMIKYNNALYPENYAFKYPKAGEKNSIVSIHVYDLINNQTNTMDIGSETDQYIPRIKWTTDNNKLSIIRENRLQNHIEILITNTNNGNSKVIYEEKNRYYIERIEDWYMTMTDDGRSFIINSEKDGWNHFYLYDIEGKLINQITKGEWDITNFIGLDSKTQTLYYQSAEESPLNKAVYSIKLDGTEKKKLSEKRGTNITVFSKGFKYYINYYSNANTPKYITLHDQKGKLIRILEDNNELNRKIKDYNFVKTEFLKINTPSSKWDLNAYMLKPNNFDHKKKYPMLMFQYGGPGSQRVTDSWPRFFAWHQMLAQKGYIVVCVDNRGTGGRGEEFKKITYRQLGKYETIDQIEAAEYFSNLPYIDENRTGIWGWSYGGFLSASGLFQGANIFEMAISVAPVSSYRFYDSIYTELYMGLPQDNAEGYDNNALLTHVDKLKGKLLLIHGTGDDNVHFQNSIELARKLTEANKQFESQFYIDKAHSIRGSNTQLHLYTRMTNFILENL